MSAQEHDEDGEMIDDEEPTPAAQPSAATRKPAGTGRPVGRPPKVVQTMGREREAPFVWGEIIRDELPKLGLHPEQVTIYVYDASGAEPVQLGYFYGNLCPDVDSFTNYVTQNYHARVRRAATYSFSFRYRGNGKTIRNASWRLPAYDELVGMQGGPQSYGGGNGGHSPPTVPAHMGYGYPAGYGQPPYYPPPPAGYGYPSQQQPPPAAPQQHPPPMSEPQQQQQQYQQQSPVQTAEGLYLQAQLGQMRVEMQQMVGQLVGAIRESRQPAGSPPGAVPAAVPAGVAGAPPATAQQSIEDMFVRALQRVGLGQQVPGAAPAAPTVPNSQGPTQTVQQTARTGLEDVMTLARTMKQLRGVMNEFDEIFSPPAAEEGPEEEHVAQPVGIGAPGGGDASLPFDLVAIPDVSFLGHPVKIARSRETGDIDWQGMAMVNPGAAEKAFELGGKLIDVFSKMGKQEVSVVGETPAGAVDANPTPPAGVGAQGGGSPPPPPTGGGFDF